MSTRPGPPPPSADRLSYLWLAVAAALLLFAGGRWVIPLAAWLAPVFLLRFVRTQPLLRGLLLAWLVRWAANALTTQGTILYPGLVPYLLLLGTTLVATLAFLAARLLAPRLPGFVGTLVFPVACTTLEYLSSFGPYGSFYSSAYSQYGDLPLLQVVAVTGIWGLTFLLTWFAAVVNWAWERGWAGPQVRGGLLLYAGVLGAVLVGGSARLVFFPPTAALVRVAGLSASRTAIAALNQQLPPATVDLLLAGQATPADRARARAAYAALDNALLADSRREARAGAKIVLWPEPSGMGANVLQEDEPALIQQAGALAHQEGIYLELGLGVFLLPGGPAPFAKDEAVLLDPAGHVVWTYEKTHPAPGEDGLFVPGDGRVPLVASPYGRLAGVICFDQDFPALIRQAGQGGADLLFGPSDDWQAIDPFHAQHATFRAIENGFSLVRQASRGLALATDYEGRVLAAADYYTTDQQVLVAYVPTHGVPTIYAAIGDLFAWLCVGGLLALTGWAIRPSRRRRSAAPAATPLPEPHPVA